MFKKIGNEMLALGFTLGASAITIMTLSGPIQNWALFFTILSLALHLAGTASQSDEDK
jgi:hypothetical protein